MKNLAFIIILLFTMTIFGCKQKVVDTKPYDFKKVNWGMSIDDVSKTEDNDDIIVHNDEMLVYSGELDGMKAQVSYNFDKDNKLVSAGYTIIEPIASSNTYIEKYKKLKADLETKYGKPERDEENWIDTFYKSRQNEYGMAVSKGELNYAAVWKLKNKQFIIQLNGENFKLDLTITYFSPAYMKKYKSEPAEGL